MLKLSLVICMADPISTNNKRFYKNPEIMDADNYWRSSTFDR